MNCAETGPLQAIPGPQAPPPAQLTSGSASRAGRTSERLAHSTGHRLPTPAGTPSGALLAAIGAVVLLFACCTSDLPWYWSENAPALWGLAGGALMVFGVLICYLRFTLRFVLLAVVVVGCSGLLAHVCGCFKARIAVQYSGSSDDLVRVINDGLIATLDQENAIPSFPRPIVVDPRYDHCWVSFRPHADRRVQGLSHSVNEVCEAICYPWTAPSGVDGQVARYMEAVRSRFGTKAAWAVARRSAELAPVRMRKCFLEQARCLEHAVPSTSTASQ